MPDNQYMKNMPHFHKKKAQEEGYEPHMKNMPNFSKKKAQEEDGEPYIKNMPYFYKKQAPQETADPPRLATPQQASPSGNQYLRKETKEEARGRRIESLSKELKRLKNRSHGLD